MDYYDENDENFDKFDNHKNWEIRINSETISYHEYKGDAIESLLEELNILSVVFYMDIETITDMNLDELIDHLHELDSIEFYDIIDNILEHYNLCDDVRFINLDNDEPEFGEL
jgi:hypothetical protein